MLINIQGRDGQFPFYNRQKMLPLNVVIISGRSCPTLDGGSSYIFSKEALMARAKNYQQILEKKILKTPAKVLAQELGISPITADWFKTIVKERHQEIVKNEMANLSTDDIAQKLDIPLELATWIKDVIRKGP